MRVTEVVMKVIFLNSLIMDSPTDALTRSMIYRFGWICKCYMSLSNLPPPTAQTNHHRDLKFGMEGHLVPNRGAIEAIFDKLPQSRDIGQGYPWGAKMLVGRVGHRTSR